MIYFIYATALMLAIKALPLLYFARAMGRIHGHS